MLPAESLLPFITTSVLLAIAPGPDNIFVLTQSTLYGKRAGILITLGLCTGLIFHTSLVALGIATLLQTTTWAFDALKTIGAFYLLILALQIWKAPLQQLAGEGAVLDDATLFVRGIIMNMTNPKVSIFFLAFLPQFADADHGSVASQIFLLGALFGVVSMMIFSGIAAVAAQLGHLLQQKPQTQLYLNRLTALILALLSLKLFFMNNI